MDTFKSIMRWIVLLPASFVVYVIAFALTKMSANFFFFFLSGFWIVQKAIEVLSILAATSAYFVAGTAIAPVSRVGVIGLTIALVLFSGVSLAFSTLIEGWGVVDYSMLVIGALVHVVMAGYFVYNMDNFLDRT